MFWYFPGSWKSIFQYAHVHCKTAFGAFTSSVFTFLKRKGKTGMVGIPNFGNYGNYRMLMLLILY